MSSKGLDKVQRQAMAGRTLTRVLSVKERLSGTLSASPNELLAVFSRYDYNLASFSSTQASIV